MSNPPNDPFQQNDPNNAYQNAGYQDPSQSNSMGGPGSGPPPKKKWPWIVGTILGLGFLSMLVCCGVAYYAYSQIGGLSAVFEPVKAELNQMADVNDEVGEIETMSMNFGDTVTEAEKNPDFIVFDLKGTTGSAQVAVKVSDDGGVEEAVLILPDGTRKPVDVTKTSGDDFDFDQIEIDSGQSGSDDPESKEDTTDQQLSELESSLDF